MTWAPSLAGISMSELLELGVADAEDRWIGVRRHQAVLAIVGLGFVGDWATRSNGHPFEVLFGVALLAGAVPMHDGLTGGELLSVATRFLARSSWTTVAISSTNGGVSLSAGGEVRFRVCELQHRGRLDLSGQDLVESDLMATLVDGLATGERTQHISVHTCSRLDGVTTLLALPVDVNPPEGWKFDDSLAAVAVGSPRFDSPMTILERWRYVRVPTGVIGTLRVHDFSAAPPGRSMLEQIQFAWPSLDVALHIDVVGGSRANRLAARAVHRVGSDDATSQAAGFRRSARSVQSLERLRQRESLIVDGRSLLRISVYLVVRANDLDELRRAMAGVMRCASQAGLRCERGFGRQASWHRYQLPGGAGW
jgi:hypothetical protein